MPTHCLSPLKCADGCEVPGREWSLKFLLGHRRGGVLLSYNTIFIDQGMHTKILSSVVVFQAQLGFLSKLNLNYSII